jgi:TldD protein
LFHEALGAHLLSGRYIKDNESTIFKDKIGRLVLPESLTVIDDPQKKGVVGHYRFDVEGIEGERLVLVKDGVLQEYLLDRDSAPFFGKLSNGHARASWVCDDDGKPFIPEPRISNLEVINKNCVSDRELMEHLKRYCRDNGFEFGLYIGSHQGEVDVETGEFHIYPHRAWKIFPDGKKELITNFRVIAHPYEILTQLELSGKRYEDSQGFCGASSGYVRTWNRACAAFVPGVNVQAMPPIRLQPRVLPKLENK